MGLVLVAILAYLYGSIPFAYLATNLTRGKALTQEGTGNVGIINAFYAGGVLAVVLTLLGDISKVLVSVGLAEILFPGQDSAKLLGIFSAFLGTNYSVFLHGRGGRGSTMLMWSIAVVSIWSCLVMCAIMGLCFLLARVDVRLKSVWVWFLPAVLFLVERDWAFVLFGILLVIVIYAKGRRSADDLTYYGHVQDKKRPAMGRHDETSDEDFSQESTR